MEKPSASLWRKIKARYNLIGNECKNCGTRYFPPRIVCRKCGRKSKMSDFKFNGDGEIVSFTKISVPPDTFKDEAPYFVGVVKLAEGPQVEGHIIDNGGKIAIGTKVRAAFRKMYVDGDEGLIYYHYKFEPV
ncbi:MAG: Zn-ribbon domain-containing OB-fold protein [Candidatus Micrarchaeota archaeon]|nr:Zn-ribbon domain-containing OB-fold protein [Candidatus Micrarchaeota archaeon]